MKAKPAATKRQKNREPFQVVKVGNVSIPIYRYTNIIPERNAAGKVIYGEPDEHGKQRAIVKYQSDIYTLAYYEGSKRVRRKFADLDKARREGELAAIKIGNGELEALKLKGHDRNNYVRAMEKLRAWNSDADLNVVVSDYVAAMKLLPENTSLKEVAAFYVKRHPTGLPVVTVRKVVDEMLEAKRKSGKSDVYVKDLELRLGQFADAFNGPISMVTGKQIEDFLRAPRPVRGQEGVTRLLAGRTQNNFRQQINTLFKFAIKRGYLPRDHDELHVVEVMDENPGETEVFTPAELRKLFDVCIAPVKERGKTRNRESMIPYLAISAFCGLRSAEVARLDWSEVHLNGPEHFIEVKAAKAKTASRRIVPVPDNCAVWLAPFVEETGPVCPFARPDKQCFHYIAPAGNIEWKRNGLRHSYISYRLAEIKNAHQVSLEAGNSPQMVFKHYYQIVTEAQSREWFEIVPPKDWKNIVPLPSGNAIEKAISPRIAQRA